MADKETMSLADIDSLLNEVMYIDGSTQIIDFPEVYNANINLLRNIIYALVIELNNVTKTKDAEIKRLQSAYNTMYASFTRAFDEKMKEFEKQFVKKEDNN